MSAREHIPPKLDRIISVLESPLTTEDAEGGWDDQSRLNWLEIFCRLRDHLSAGKSLYPEYDGFSVGRGFDSWGIGLGPLSRLAFDIDSDLRHAVRDEARMRGESPEKDDTKNAAGPDTMKYIHKLLSEHWSEGRNDKTSDDRK